MKLTTNLCAMQGYECMELDRYLTIYLHRASTSSVNRETLG
jgi:hypothetical protein